MSVLTIKSKKYGTFRVLLDKEDFTRATNIGRTPKWCVSIKNRSGLVYFQKLLPRSKKLVELHRWVMGNPKGKVIDHINGNTLDNRRKNLRICSVGSNVRKGKIRTNNTSGYTGVRLEKRLIKKSYVVNIRVNYKDIYVGTYNTFEEAVKARKMAELKYYYL
jgi:hypothetical protein